MTDIRGKGTPITYDRNNEYLTWMWGLSKERAKRRREPRTDAEKKLLAEWLAYRGRWELEHIVGSACHALAHFDIDPEWRWTITDHIRDEAGHGWGYIRNAQAIDNSRDYTKRNLDWEDRYGLLPRADVYAVETRDFLSYLFAGNLWIYGHLLSMTIQDIDLITPRLDDFQRNVVQAEEGEHHNAILQKMHDYVWELIEQFGEESVKKRIAQIDQDRLNVRCLVPFDPSWRTFLVEHLGSSLECVDRFHEFRRYLYLSVLGWEPEPVNIRYWPEQRPQVRAA